MASIGHEPRRRHGRRRASLLCSSLALFAATCHAEANSPELAEPEARIMTPAPAADAAVARPTESVLALRRAASLDGDAAIVARADALASAGGADEAQLLWLAASLDADRSASDARLERIATGASPLAPWAAIELARRALEADPARARERLSAVLGPRAATLGLDARWAGHDEARALDALALARLGDRPVEEREAALRGALAPTLVPGLYGDLTRALADLLVARGDPDAAREAIDLYDALLARATLGASAPLRAARAAALEALSDADRAALREPSVARARERAAYLSEIGRAREAASGFVELARRFEPGSVERCQALLDAGRVLARARAREAAVEQLDAMVVECEPALARALERALERIEPEPSLASRRDALAWASYTAGRALVSMGRGNDALSRLAAVERLAPSHRLLDDALVLEARIRLEAGDRDCAREALERAVAQEGDLRGEARFLLAWELRGEGRLADALATLEASLAEGTGEAAEGVVGRAAYWRARLLAELGRSADALDAYEALARAQPLTYYGRLALARIDERDAGRGERLREATLRGRLPLARALEDGDSLVARSSFARAVAERLSTAEARATFARATALLVVGERQRGERELASLGIDADAGADTVRTLAALLADTGYPTRATELARRRLPPMVASPDDDASLALYRIAYPDAYAGLIEEAAAREGVDPSFVRAVAREESSFDPGAVSVARAYGLLQIITPTAERYARGTGLASDPAALRVPAINVQIGVRYMRALARRYGEHAAFIPPAYNAGEGNVDRWMRARRDQPFDAWVEEIPFAETRGYTRRVLQSWIIYGFLDRGAFPTLPATLPARG